MSFPRVAFLLVVIFSDYIGNVYQGALIPILGFLFMPLTTLAYAWAYTSGSGDVHGIGLIAVILAVLCDIGLIGGSGHSSKKVVVGKQKCR